MYNSAACNLYTAPSRFADDYDLFARCLRKGFFFLFFFLLCLALLYENISLSASGLYPCAHTTGWLWVNYSSRPETCAKLMGWPLARGYGCKTTGYNMVHTAVVVVPIVITKYSVQFIPERIAETFNVKPLNSFVVRDSFSHTDIRMIYDCNAYLRINQIIRCSHYIAGGRCINVFVFFTPRNYPSSDFGFPDTGRIFPSLVFWCVAHTYIIVVQYIFSMRVKTL